MSTAVLSQADWYLLLKDFAGPVATVCAAAAAAFVAYRLGSGQLAIAKAQAETANRNWQTANEKVVIDLMDKRVDIYENIRSIIGEVLRHGAAPDELQFRYLQAVDRAPYFFGKEVVDYLEQMRLTLIDLELANDMLAAHDSEENWAQKRAKHWRQVTKFHEEGSPLFAPYIKAHQKA